MPGRLHSGDGHGHNGKVLENDRDMAGFGCYFTWSAAVFLPNMLDSLRAAVRQAGDDATAPTDMLDALARAASAGAKRKVGGGQGRPRIAERCEPSASRLAGLEWTQLCCSATIMLQVEAMPSFACAQRRVHYVPARSWRGRGAVVARSHPSGHFCHF